MRQNREKAAREQRRNGRGPVYSRLLAFEVAQDARYRSLGRPRPLLEQMQAGESVTVPAWRVPELARVLGCEPSMRVVVAPDV